MHDHVDKARHTMFNHATDNVRQQLKAMCDKICQELWDQILQVIFKNLSRDYLSVLGNDGTKTASVITRAGRMLRGELSLMLARDADVVFKDCLPGADTAAVQQPTVEQTAVGDPVIKDEPATQQGGDAPVTMEKGSREPRDHGFSKEEDPLPERRFEDP